MSCMKPCRNVGIIISNQYLKYSSKHPKYLNRLEIVINLIRAYNLLDCLTVYPAFLSEDRFDEFLHQLTSYHSLDYLLAVQKLSELHLTDDVDLDQMNFEEFGLVYDCSGFPGLLEFALSSVAATLVAAQAIVSDKVKVCINWGGGWHHAKRFEASGFCYMNDIVYGIMVLLKRFHRILYIDIDLHHGDGVEEAFLYSPRVFTLSIHHAAPGFFPATETSCTGQGAGRYSAAQFAFRTVGVTDELYCSTFDRLLDAVIANVKPETVVIQCGTDGLCSDPLGVFNLTHVSYEHVISRLLALNLPMLVLGGGGYNYVDTARVWVRLTALLLGVSISNDIPDHDGLELYGPCFDCTISSSSPHAVQDLSGVDSEIERIVDQLGEYRKFNDS